MDDSALAHFMAGLRQVESGGRYAIGKNAAGASGAYQFLDSTWAGYGGYKSAYLAPPEVQDARAAQLMTSYYQRFGNWGAVAQAWLGGPGSVGKNVTDHYTGITSNQYVAKVLRLAGASASGQQLSTNVTPRATPAPAATQAPATQTDPDPHDIGTQLANLSSLIASPLDFSPKGVTSGQDTGATSI